MAKPDKTPAPRLNVGSGMMLKEGWVNFDCKEFENHGIKTNVVGRIENIVEIFGERSFMTILCSHVIEHFYFREGIKVLQDLFKLLRRNGKLILEAPDINGIYWLMKQRNLDDYWLSQMLFGDPDHVENHGVEWAHKAGWSRHIAETEMKKIGFDVVHVGRGMTHGMGKRDFRVEGVRRD